MVIVGMTGYARSRVQGSDFEDILPKIFWSFAPERLKVEISAKNLKCGIFGEGNAARVDDRVMM